jgi:hypothetical protein
MHPSETDWARRVAQPVTATSVQRPGLVEEWWLLDGVTPEDEFVRDPRLTPVTTMVWREDGAWKVVHRRRDELPADGMQSIRLGDP